MRKFWPPERIFRPMSQIRGLKILSGGQNFRMELLSLR
jgi:hypothetical protein